jgi:hypothetical protein
MRNLIAQPLSSLNTIQLLVSAELKRFTIYVNSWHDAKRSELSLAKALRREGKLFNELLCAFAPLREIFFIPKSLVCHH